MTDADRQAFGEALGTVAEIFGETLSSTRLEGYFLSLSEFEFSAVSHAIAIAMKSCKFFPRPAELIEVIQGSVEDQAELAWRRFLEALEGVGTYRTVDFDDPAMHQVIERFGGWHECWQIERLDPKALDFKRQEFKQLYRIFLRRSSLAMCAPRVLVGQHQMENDRTRETWTRGIEPVNPVMQIGAIGECARAVRPQLIDHSPEAIKADGAT